MDLPINANVVRRIMIGILFSFVAATSVAYAGQYGTYSSLIFSKESGDLNGYEVEFIPTNSGLKAVVLVAEGEVTGIYVVDVRKGSGNSLLFTFPLGRIGRMATFVGKIHDGKLEGTITLPSGKMHAILHRSVGYWNYSQGRN